MLSRRRQVLVGSLVLATAFIPGAALAANADAKPVIEAMAKVRTAAGTVHNEFGTLAAKEGKVVMRADLNPLGSALNELVGARDNLVTAWRAWSKGEHKDVDEKLTTLAKNLGDYRTALSRVPAGGVLTPTMVSELRTQDDASSKVVGEIGERIDAVTA